MAVVLEGLVAGPLILCGVYLVLSMYCCYYMISAHKLSSKLSIRKVFAMNCFLTGLLRAMSFASIAALAMLGYGSSDDDDNSSETQDFYEKALVVLFDFPDFSIVSAYVLLFLVWCEAFVQVCVTTTPIGDGMP